MRRKKEIIELVSGISVAVRDGFTGNHLLTVYFTSPP